MLRILLGEAPRVNEGPLADAINAMAEQAAALRKEMNRQGDRNHESREIEIWTRGLITSLDELEQSWFAAAHFRRSVRAGFVDEMTPDEQGEYARYVYFYKNGFIRVFSLLDKLGTVLNSRYDLCTSALKPHFSYFTVLRQLRTRKELADLSDELEGIRKEYRDALQKLRKRRNAEIHYMNSEMQDDLWQRHQGLEERIALEDLDGHLEDLRQGLEMVCRTLAAAYRYMGNQRHS
ncbi:hypothetical protein F4V43_00350 [Paenibacillus spiritus]|uniref:Cthe-2314-like HEPN domain-containing protein n=1 Tax=Paenibacillus spiritus TaxID=2496557 RepID=A0A5J5GK38_9BACL|nr:MULTISPECIES: Cthe_2314 family HEPN domain-containing protein [Paenibacillus]KAA9008619.1 hypothetical protein F4V43_00350 [Paenibacillus spiritus]